MESRKASKPVRRRRNKAVWRICEVIGFSPDGNVAGVLSKTRERSHTRAHLVIKGNLEGGRWPEHFPLPLECLPAGTQTGSKILLTVVLSGAPIVEGVEK